MADNDYNTIKPAHQMPVLSKVNATRDKKGRNGPKHEKKKSTDAQEDFPDQMQADEREKNPPQNDIDEHNIDFCA